MNKKIPALKKQIQAILLFFMVALALSGATAIPAYSEIGWLLNHLPRGWFVSLAATCIHRLSRYAKQISVSALWVRLAGVLHTL